MPRGFHYGRNRTRAYTSEYNRIHAKLFKPLLIGKLGGYTINNDALSHEHKTLQLSESESGIRIATFTINDTPHQIALKLDDRSASKKLYITCPYCQKQRQHLYAVKFAYACRECLKLHYATQAERPRDRLMRKIRKKRISIWELTGQKLEICLLTPAIGQNLKAYIGKHFGKQEMNFIN